MSLPESILGLEPESFIELFQFDQYRLDQLAETQYFANHSGVVFKGNAYVPIPLESSGFEQSSDGPTPQPRVTLSNVGNVVANFVAQLKTEGYRLEGARVTRILTQPRYLDGGVEATAAVRELPPEVFYIEQLAAQNRELVSFRLRTAMETEGVKLPNRIALRSCSWEYRSENCGYVGGFVDINNRPTPDPNLDQCPYSLEGCEVRFGDAAVLPFGGFPGLGQY